MDKLKTLQQNPIFAKYRYIIFPVISCTISFALLIFVVFGQISNSLKQQAEISDLQKKVVELTKKNSDLERIDDTSFAKYLNTSLMALPEEKDITGVIGQLLYLLQSNNLNLDNLNFSSVTPEGNLETYQIRLEIQGSSPEIRNFIDNLNSVPRIVKLNNLELNSNRNTQKVQAVISLKTYFKKQPSAIGGAEEPLIKPTEADLKLLSKIEEKIKIIPLASSQDATSPKGKSDPFN